jgi:hypothetical protein
MRILPLVTTIFAITSLLVGCGITGSEPLPVEKPETVVNRFYEHLSEAGIRGGNISIKEAYKLVSPLAGLHQQRFAGIVKKYPPGFLAKVVKSTVDVDERIAMVTIEYRMASMFGNGYMVSTDIPLVVDEENKTWKIDFTGEFDSQDQASIRKNMKKAM